MSLSIRRMTAFVRVAQARSVTAAARELNMTPPAVTKSVRELEANLSTELFHRTSRGMQLTAAGEAFVIHAERALAEIEHGRQEVANLLGGAGGRVAVGATPEAANLILPNALVRLINHRRGVKVAMHGGTFETLMRDVRSGALDFFVSAMPEEGPPPGLACEDLHEDELIIIVRPDHPLTRQESLSLGDLAPFQWIDATGRGTLAGLMRRSFQEAGIEKTADEGLEIHQLGAMRAVLKHTDLFAVATRMRVHEELQLGLLVTLPIALPDTSHTVATFYQQNAYLPVRAKELLGYLHQEARRVAAQKPPRAAGS